MSLLKRALQMEPGKVVEYEITEEEIELYLAFIQSEVTFRQVYLVLGRSYGFASNWVKRCTMYLFQRGMMQVNWNNQTMRWKPKTYGFTKDIH